MYTLARHQAHLRRRFSSLLKPSSGTGVQHTLKIDIHITVGSRLSEQLEPINSQHAQISELVWISEQAIKSYCVA